MKRNKKMIMLGEFGPGVGKHSLIKAWQARYPACHPIIRIETGATRFDWALFLKLIEESADDK